jgi:hypothetical protein
MEDKLEIEDALALEDERAGVDGSESGRGILVLSTITPDTGIAGVRHRVVESNGS